MAEVVGVVASGAGLVSLALQLVDLASRLRNRCENVRTIQHMVKELHDDIIMNTSLLRNLEEEHLQVLELQLGPVMLSECLLRGNDVARRLEGLIQKLPNPSSSSYSGRTLLMAFRSKARKEEVAELRTTVASFKHDINTLISLISLQQVACVRKQLIASGLLPNNDNKRHNIPSSSAEDYKSTPVLSEPLRPSHSHRIPYCAIKHCHCSCHGFQQVNGRFWFLQYTPMATILNGCDNPGCTSRRYRIDFRIALSRLGIPWAAVLGMGIVSEPGRYHLKPALQIQRVVRYTAPGFDTLFKLSEGGISLDVAKAQFDALYKSDPGFIKQVDPEGLGFLEKVLQHGSWELQGGFGFEAQYELLSYFTKNLGMSLRVTTTEVLYCCITDYYFTSIFEQLVDLGFDFSDVPSPNFERWPKPCLSDESPSPYITVIPDDPFFLQFIRTLILSNPDFGGITALQESILHGPLDDCQSRIRSSRSLESDVNFLGQTPLHLAIDQPSHLKLLLDSGHSIDVRDKNGATPLMYAAALDLKESISILVEWGADLSIKDSIDGSDFVDYAAMRCHWSLIWYAVDAVEKRDKNLLVPLFTSVKSWLNPSLPCADGGIKFIQDFWRIVPPKLKSLNVYFDDGSTLLHIAQNPKLAKVLIEGGYTLFDHQDNNGEHCLFAVARFLDPSLLQLCVDKGISINIRNKKGMTVLHQLLSHLGNPQGEKVKRILDCLDILTDNGTDIEGADKCVCRCSSHGCLPTSGLELGSDSIFGYRLYNPFWIFEWLYMLEERGRLSTAKVCATAIIRKSRFDRTGLRHKCHTYHSRVDNHVDCEEEDAFWDIESNVKLDQLDSEMQTFESMSYEEVKLSILREIQAISNGIRTTPHNEKSNTSDRDRANRGVQQSNITSSTEQKQTGYYIDYEGDCLYTQLDIFLLKPKGMESLFGDMDMDFMHSDEGDIDVCFSEFVDGLRSARGESFFKRHAMIRQMAEVLGMSVSL